MSTNLSSPASGAGLGADLDLLSQLGRDLRACGVLLTDDEIVLDVPFDRPLLDELQRLGGRFDPRRKRWIVPRGQLPGLAPLLPSLRQLVASHPPATTRT